MDQWKIYFLLKLGIFQPAMLVYWEVYPEIENLKLSRNNWVYPLTVYSWSLLCSLFGFLGIFSSINTHYRGGLRLGSGYIQLSPEKGEAFCKISSWGPLDLPTVGGNLRTPDRKNQWGYYTDPETNIYKPLKTRVYMGLFYPLKTLPEN